MYYCPADNYYICKQCREGEHKSHPVEKLKDLAIRIKQSLIELDKKMTAEEKKLRSAPLDFEKKTKILAGDVLKQVDIQFSRQLREMKRDVNQTVKNTCSIFSQRLSASFDFLGMKEDVNKRLAAVRELASTGEYWTICKNFSGADVELQRVKSIESAVQKAFNFCTREDVDIALKEAKAKLKGLFDDLKKFVDTFPDRLKSDLSKKQKKNDRTLLWVKDTKLYTIDLESLAFKELVHNKDFSYSNQLTTSNGRLFLTGGKKNLTSTFELDKAQQDFISKANMANGRYFHAFVQFRDSILLALGGYNGTPMNECEAYDIDTDKWSPISSLVEKRFRFTAFCYDQTFVYIACGYNQTLKTTNTMERVALGSLLDGKWESFEVKNKGFAPCYSIGSLSLNDKETLLFGGVSTVSAPQCMIFNRQKNEITLSAAKITDKDEFYGHSIGSYKGKSYVLSLWGNLYIYGDDKFEVKKKYLS